MKCTNCGNDNVNIVQETEGNVEANGLFKVICTWVICLPWGLYTLLNQKDSRATVNYKYCPDCGKKDRI